MKANLQQLEEMQKELFRQQCDLDIQKAMVKHFIKKKKAEQLPIYGVVRKSEQFKCDNGCDWYSVGHQLNGHQQCRKCGKQKAF